MARDVADEVMPSLQQFQSIFSAPVDLRFRRRSASSIAVDINNYHIVEWRIVVESCNTRTQTRSWNSIEWMPAKRKKKKQYMQMGFDRKFLQSISPALNFFPLVHFLTSKVQPKSPPTVCTVGRADTEGSEYRVRKRVMTSIILAPHALREFILEVIKTRTRKQTRMYPGLY